jgi:molecular chaperone DnaK (HSP70)
MDIVNALGSLKQFDEIRYISESEAVLCYYIYHHSKFNKDKNGLKDETVLIFDMGGATINATIADAYFNKEDRRYKIDIDSKVGYNVGGDTVDYCLAKYFLSFSSDYPDLEKINPFIKGINKEEIIRRKQKIIPILFDLKKKIIRNYENRSKITISLSSERRILLYPAEIQNAFKELGVKMILSNASKIFTNLMENEFGNFPIFSFSYFQEYIFDAIKDAVNDVVKLSRAKGGHIDTIIFSGRTTLFPMIKETVTTKIRQIKSVKTGKKGQAITPVWVTFDNTELKTAVAKGACIYGINRNLIDVSKSKTNNTIGFLKRESLTKNHFEFKELIKVSQNFEEESENVHFIKGERIERIDFKADNSKINFIQVVGIDPDKIIREEQKHKYSELAQIKISNPTEKISATLKNDDSIMFEVELNTGHIETIFSTLKSQEVSEANEEHYTWMAKS